MEDFKKETEKQFEDMNKVLKKDIGNMFKAYDKMVEEVLNNEKNKNKKVGK